MEPAFVLRLSDGREFSVTGETRLGCEPPCEVLLNDPLGAPLHATFWVEGSSLFVRAAASGPGAYLQETPLPPDQPVQVLLGDQVRLGNTIVTVGAGGPAAPVPAADAPFVLRCSDGRTFHVKGEMKIGRDPSSHLFLPDTWVSRRHATVWVSEGTLYVRDEGSRIGTFVNETALAAGEAAPLRLGDSLRLGVTTLTVAGVAAGTAAPPDPTLMMRGKPAEPTGAFMPVKEITPVHLMAPGALQAAQAAPAFRVRAPDGKEWAVTGETRLGRDLSCQIVLPDLLVSRYHAVFLVQEGELFVRDEGSRNGTFVAGARLEPGQLTPLASGAQVRVGDTTLTILQP